MGFRGGSNCLVQESSWPCLSSFLEPPVTKSYTLCSLCLCSFTVNNSGFPNISREMDSGGCYVVGGEVKTEVVFCSITVCYLSILVVVTSQDCEYETSTVKIV